MNIYFKLKKNPIALLQKQENPIIISLDKSSVFDMVIKNWLKCMWSPIFNTTTLQSKCRMHLK